MSGVLGVAFALAQHDIKRLLAYHSVENIGIIALGIGAGLLGLSWNQPVLVVLGFGGGLALIGGLAAACFAKAFGIVFLGEPRSSPAAEAREVGATMRWPMAVLAVICLGIGLLAPLALRIVLLLTEDSRIPIDDPNTHLELTMIHEVMVLDYSGPDFAYILYGASLKLWIFAALVVNVIVPVRSLPAWGQIPLFLLGMAVVTILVGIVESILARLRLRQVPKILIGSAALSVIALIVRLMG